MSETKQLLDRDGNVKATVVIKERLAVLGESYEGYTKELNLVQWNEGAEKYDIREWSPNHNVVHKGVLLTAEELDALRNYFLSEAGITVKKAS
ncbi:MAG: hypothetical protein LBN08_05270 [Lactobacillales bacterium]|nr:hypothetical protein [Lactobacillales bacterium]